jgi:hypothetical protein
MVFARSRHWTTVLGPYRVVTDPKPRGYASATLAAGAVPGVMFPVFAYVNVPGQIGLAIWLHEEHNSSNIAPGTAAMSTRLRRRLMVTAADALIEFHLSEHITLRVSTPSAHDLPGGGDVQVDESVYRRFLLQNHSRRALLTTSAGLGLPVRLEPRRHEHAIVRVPLSLRVLAGVGKGDDIQLSAQPKQRPLSAERALQRIFSRVPPGAPGRRLGLALGWLVMLPRLVDFGLEMLLRAAFRAPVLALRITQAHPGDDVLANTVRLHPAAMSAIGCKPGGQVLLKWGGRQIAVRALEDHAPHGEGLSATVMASVGIRYEGELPADFPPHLVVRVPAPVRTQMGIPPHTAVEARRKIRPALLGQLNQLATPLVGLVLAAVAIPDIRGWPVLVGTAIAIVFGLAPLRMPRPPRGPWP